ncbi:DUF1330 domain-containing protein [Acuticoccus sp. I52.16.1]|uniref:DUF1330 domain-containing protein n=1 Tax=Acuticoccus sp. I52.16.1 TaxID=2928472 RepID=UPI001FD13435|nr:DUF1330 domain-containing protein [Acuticoccus sp. I52.16.1]UOM33597.1 DUF1330 domain-containing protein [Acuticoccus sp. I52.16.1]
MAKGYWMARVDVHDPEGYKEYVALNGAPIAEFGGKFLVRGGPFEAVVGEARQRNVVIEFPTYQAALDCFYSEGYQKALAVRERCSVSEQVIIEGYDGPQPGQ